MIRIDQPFFLLRPLGGLLKSLGKQGALAAGRTCRRVSWAESLLEVKNNERTETTGALASDLVDFAEAEVCNTCWEQLPPRSPDKNAADQDVFQGQGPVAYDMVHCTRVQAPNLDELALAHVHFSCRWWDSCSRCLWPECA